MTKRGYSMENTFVTGLNVAQIELGPQLWLKVAGMRNFAIRSIVELAARVSDRKDLVR